jgi:hypothetical protein
MHTHRARRFTPIYTAPSDNGRLSSDTVSVCNLASISMATDNVFDDGATLQVGVSL